MAPFRPTNVNLRSYPGNANVVGPTISATLGVSTTSCCSSTVVCDACSSQNVLGCRCTFNACPCCSVCCCCPCTVCVATVPSGMWSSFEQYEARTRNAWDVNFCSTGAAVCLCCTNVGVTCIGSCTGNCNGWFWCCGPGTNKWFVAPYCTEAAVNWFNRGTATTNANSIMGSLGWFVPSIGQLHSAAFCKGYWDTYRPAVYAPGSGPSEYWSNDDCNNPPNAAYVIIFANNIRTGRIKNTGYYARAIRCTAS